MAEPRTVRENANALNSEQIAALLPHRYPFALVDRILDYEPGQWAIGRKCVSRNEEFFCGHFPGQPVMPGVLILEALAQTGAVAALSVPENKGKLALFGGIKNARFRKQVTPGDVLTLHCELVEQRGPVGIGKASAYVDGKCAATAELTFVLSVPENKGKLALFGGIKNARFRKQVTPGDVLTLHCELVEQRGPVGIGKASAYVDGKCAATAELTFVLTEANTEA